MQNSTKQRTLKIYEYGDFFHNKTNPEIRLKGQWLARAGFTPNNHVKIEFPEPGKMVITSRSINTQN